MVSLGSNISALRALGQLSRTSFDLSRSLERLSSGQRINRASDDSAGSAIASSLNINSRVLTQGVRNLNDGLSVLTLAEGTLSNLSTVTDRLKELAQQAANGTLSLTQRSSLDQEADSLVKEFNRLMSSTKFNGVSILDADFNTLLIQAGFGTDSISFSTNGALKHKINDGTFLADSSLSFGTGNKGGTVAVDFNNDGILDLASVGGGAGLRVELGNGDGTFQAVQSYAMAAPSGITAGDFNGDGFQDLFVGATLGATQVFLNDGDGTFTQTASFTDISISGRETTDINGDGFSDLVYTSGNSFISYRLSNGDGTFQGAQTIASSLSLQHMELGDFNGDGIVDVLATQKSGSNLALFLGGAGGTFTEQTTFSGGFGNIISISLGDTNDDGLLDILVNGSTGLGVLTGTSSSTFSIGSNLRTLVSEAKLIDLDGDGFLDIVSGDGSGFEFRKNDGTGNFNLESTTTSTIRGFVVGDFNGDGALDVVGTATGDANLHLLLADGVDTTSIGEFNIHTAAGALEALNQLSTIQSRVASQLGQIGAAQSRIGYALGAAIERRDGYKSAESRIVDVDVASEVAHSIRLQILQQSGAAILAQANQLPALALTLLGQTPNSLA